MKKILMACLICLFLSACGAGNTNTTYSRAQIGKRGSTSTGVIVAMEVVTTKGENTGLGTLAGGAAGAIGGSAIGGGRGSALAAIGVGVAGAIAGHVIEDKILEDTAFEFLVQEDKTGDVISVVQSNELELQPGDHVILVELDGVTRIRQKMVGYRKTN